VPFGVLKQYSDEPGGIPSFVDTGRGKLLTIKAGGRMNRSPRSGFSNGLTSGLTIFAIFTIGFSINGLAQAAENPPANKPSQVDSMEIPGTFKELLGKMDAITSKRIIDDAELISTGSAPATLPVIDASKGISRNFTNESLKNNSLKNESLRNEDVKADPADFHATAYCLKGRTASGEYTRPGVIAADPRVLPIGTVVHIRAGRYTGKYTVLDTGAKIKGRTVDIYFPSYREAVAFGRQRIKLQVLGRPSRSAPRKTARKADPSQKNSVIATL
jgi:3D (Asp-Asp-Asp) domain-containing protein